MRVTCGTCGASIDTAGPPHVCATDVTVARRDLPPFEPRLPTTAPPPPVVEPQQQWATVQQPTYVAAPVQMEAPGRRPGAVPWFVAGVGAVLIVASAVVLLTRGGDDDAAVSTSVPAASDSTAAVVETTQPPVATAAPAATAAPVATAAPAVTVAVTAAPQPVAVLLPSSTWNGRYGDEPVVGPLFIGHQGRRVEAVQRALIDRGYLAPPADGDYGRGTEAAIAQLQRDLGLEVDGIADADTLAALGVS